jgi:hypothetical protein
MMLTAGIEAAEGKSYLGSTGWGADGSATLATDPDFTAEVCGSLSAPGSCLFQAEA